MAVQKFTIQGHNVEYVNYWHPTLTDEIEIQEFVVDGNDVTNNTGDAVDRKWLGKVIGFENVEAFLEELWMYI